ASADRHPGRREDRAQEGRLRRRRADRVRAARRRHAALAASAARAAAPRALTAVPSGRRFARLGVVLQRSLTVLDLVALLAGGLPAGRRIDADGLAPVDVVVLLARRGALLPLALAGLLGLVLRLPLQLLRPLVRAESRHAKTSRTPASRGRRGEAMHASIQHRAGVCRSSMPSLGTETAAPAGRPQPDPASQATTC